MDRELFRSEGFENSITVPFAPQSKLSGVGFTDFIPEMWYHRTLDIPSGWAGDRIILHFGAVDYIASVYVDGRIAGRHWGGSSSFAIDITRFVTAGKTHNLVVRVEDNERGGEYGKGKQSERYGSYGCLYTRTTGIWQTVWMEAVPLTGAGCSCVTHPCAGRRHEVLLLHAMPLDLHVLSLPLAFILSQDQTLHCILIIVSPKCPGCCIPVELTLSLILFSVLCCTCFQPCQ